MNTAQKDKLADNVSSDYYKFLEFEAKESIQSFRSLATVLVQIATVFSTANVVIVGYAVSNSKASLFILGAGVTTILLIAFRGGIKASVPLLCRFIELEKKFQLYFDQQSTTGFTTLLLNIFGQKFLNELNTIAEKSDQNQKRRLMKKLEQRMYYRYTTNRGTLILMGAIIFQLALTAILMLVFHWEFL